MGTDKQTEKMANRQADDLLGELESIKSLLGEELEQIPVLEEIVEETPPLSPAVNNPAKQKPNHVLPGQQALFEPNETTKAKPKKPAPAYKATGENPFLPQHIRERLGSSAEISKSLVSPDREIEKQSLLQPTEEDSRFVSAPTTSAPNIELPEDLEITDKTNTPTPSSLKTTIANPDNLIDSLVKQYMPIIEDELRRQLQSIAEGKPPE